MTDTPSWNRVKAVIDAALERSPSERAAFVQQACGDNRALRAEVESLLAAMEQAGSFVEQPAIQSLAASDARAVGSILEVTGSALKPGDSLGHLKIVEFVGAGGMGEVYRARDSRLKRDVALKVLPEVFASDADRLARFRREAQVLASLNHQNIGAIFGLEESPGAMRALVLEFVEGQTLQDIIAAAGLPTTEALPIALQIAEALEAAHERGVVHRDLKPANVKVRPDGVVKVLDFGLARALDAAPLSNADVTNSPTVTGPGPKTDTGVIIGTAPYMSPEQARGQVVDKRTDIWAFGCVLFEMLAGRRAFDGETSSDTMAAILAREPDWTALPGTTPGRVRALLQRCLEKDPKRRLRDIGDARIEIDHLVRESRTIGAETPHVRLASRWVAVAAVLVLLAAGAFVAFDVRRSPTIRPQYTQITDFSDSATAPSLSPDGRMVTFIRGGVYFQSRGQIYVKVLPDGEAVRLTNDPRPKLAPVFTPDGSRIAYSVIDAGSWDTWTVPVLGGQPTRLLPNASGLTWMPDRRVLFSQIKSGLHMGIVTATEVRADSREIYFPEHERAMAHYSYASPDRQSILIVEMGPGGGFTQPCRLIPFDGSSRGGLVGPQGPCRSAAWSPDGRWMYFEATVEGRSHLWRQAFPNGALEQITFDPTEEEGIAVAPDGHSLVTSVGEQRSAIWLHDETGDRQITSEGSARSPQLSRDGRQLFFLQGSQVPASELRRLDLASGKSDNVLPGWPMGFFFDVSPDATEVTFSNLGKGGELVTWLASLDRRSPPREVTRGGDQASFGPNGTLIFRQREKNANYLYRINRDGSGRERFLSTPILGKSAISPDGEWVIVNRTPTDGDTTQAEVVAVPLRGGPPRKMCAFNCVPWTWSSDGKLLYISFGQLRTVVLPVPAGHALPDVPASGILSPADAAKLPGARAIEPLAFPGPNASTYVVQKVEIRRNLYRIQLR